MPCGACESPRRPFPGRAGAGRENPVPGRQWQWQWQVRGTVVVPAGFSLPLAALTAAAGLGSSAVRADGAFTVPVNAASSAGPTLIWLRNANDVLLIGFGGESGSGTVTLSAESTAVALVYFALGGFGIPAENRAELLDLIAADASLPPLIQTVTQQIGTNPLALMRGNPAIGAALRDVLTAMGATASRDAGATGRSVKTLSTSPTRSRAADAQLRLSPTGLHSNLEVLQGNTAQSIIATNHSRRYCRVHTYRTGTEDASGNRTDYPTARAVGGTVALTSTGALGIFSTIRDFTSGQTAFVAGWRSERTRLNLTSWLSDIILGLLLEIWGLRDITDSGSFRQRITFTVSGHLKSGDGTYQADVQATGKVHFIDA